MSARRGHSRCQAWSSPTWDFNWVSMGAKSPGWPPAGEAGPFAVPGLVVPDLGLQLILYEGKIAELAAGGEGEQRVVRPAIVAREELEHYCPSSSLTGGTTGLPSLIFMRFRASAASSGA